MQKNKQGRFDKKIFLWKRIAALNTKKGLKKESIIGFCSVSFAKFVYWFVY